MHIDIIVPGLNAKSVEDIDRRSVTRISGAVTAIVRPNHPRTGGEIAFQRHTTSMRFPTQIPKTQTLGYGTARTRDEKFIRIAQLGTVGIDMTFNGKRQSLIGSIGLAEIGPMPVGIVSHPNPVQPAEPGSIALSAVEANQQFAMLSIRDGHCHTIQIRPGQSTPARRDDE